MVSSHGAVQVVLGLAVVDDPVRRARHAFLCCAPADSAAADMVQVALVQAGIRVWRSSSDISPGEDWRAKVRQAVSGDAVVFLALFSRASCALERSRHHEELSLAVDEMRQRSPEVPWLIPVRLDDCEIPDLEIGAGRTLRSLQVADLFGPDRAEAERRLVASAARRLGSEQVPPGPYADRGFAYLRQVRRIAPPDPPGLLDREEELAELAGFCVEPCRGPYAWWRGGAGAGKSALLSTFVLRSPPAGVKIVSFFITA